MDDAKLLRSITTVVQGFIRKDTEALVGAIKDRDFFDELAPQVKAWVNPEQKLYCIRVQPKKVVKFSTLFASPLLNELGGIDSARLASQPIRLSPPYQRKGIGS